MKDLPRVGFVCVGENALELSSAICCAGRFMRLFSENGYMTGGSYSCINPSSQMKLLRDRISHMCACNDVVVTIGCDGFREGDVVPEIIDTISSRSLSYFSCLLSGECYVDADTGKSHKCFPSRSNAVLTGSTILLSVPAELHSSLGKLSCLMSAISHAVSGRGENVCTSSLDLADLIADFYVEHSFHD